jgi:hypothetical protein
MLKFLLEQRPSPELPLARPGHTRATLKAQESSAIACNLDARRPRDTPFFASKDLSARRYSSCRSSHRRIQQIGRLAPDWHASCFIFPRAAR